ncbi:MAG: zf-HC2 domain-containing protein [Nannocystaceae bacterium]|nr:zf-HC2 domain-containing protein [Nannocystaceae bacterium]
MNCQQVFDRLSAYMDGELSASDRSAFEGHVASCTRCSQFGEEFVAVVLALRGVARPRPPESLLDRLRLPDD